MRQYVAVRFNPNDHRTYTYHHDGEPVAVGDDVKIADGDRWKRALVISIAEEEPPFPTKAILGKAPAAEGGE
jgi:hypothetical protein